MPQATTKGLFKMIQIKMLSLILRDHLKNQNELAKTLDVYAIEQITVFSSKGQCPVFIYKNRCYFLKSSLFFLLQHRSITTTKRELKQF